MRLSVSLLLKTAKCCMYQLIYYLSPVFAFTNHSSQHYSILHTFPCKHKKGSQHKEEVVFSTRKLLIEN